MMSLSLTALCPTALAVEARGGRVEGVLHLSQGHRCSSVLHMFLPSALLRWNPGGAGQVEWGFSLKAYVLFARGGNLLGRLPMSVGSDATVCAWLRLRS